MEHSMDHKRYNRIAFWITIAWLAFLLASLVAVVGLPWYFRDVPEYIPSPFVKPIEPLPPGLEYGMPEPKG